VRAAHLCTSGLTADPLSTSSFWVGVDRPREPRPLRLLLAAAVPPVWLGPEWGGGPLSDLATYRCKVKMCIVGSSYVDQTHKRQVPRLVRCCYCLCAYVPEMADRQAMQRVVRPVTSPPVSSACCAGLSAPCGVLPTSRDSAGGTRLPKRLLPPGAATSCRSDCRRWLPGSAYHASCTLQG